MRLVALIVACMLLNACGNAENGAAPASSPSASDTSDASRSDTAPLAPALHAETPRAPNSDMTGLLASLPEPYNAGNLGNGRREFAKCKSCHLISPDMRHLVGPNLYGLFDRGAGEAEGFRYSPALIDASFTWTPEQLDAWLADPRGFLPGNRMTFLGVRDEQDRRDVIAYLMVETDPS